MTTNRPSIYRAKPVTVEAMRYPDRYPPGVDPSSDGYARNHQAFDLYHWVESNTAGGFEPTAVLEGRRPCPESGVAIDPANGQMLIATLEGVMRVSYGDYVVRGVAGEFYPCKPDVFHAKYAPVV